MTGRNLRIALKRAHQLGGIVEHLPGTGEVRVRFPGLPSVRTSVTRKDAPRVLTTLLRQLGRGL